MSAENTPEALAEHRRAIRTMNGAAKAARDAARGLRSVERLYDTYRTPSRDAGHTATELDDLAARIDFVAGVTQQVADDIATKLTDTQETTP